ncbi:MAG: XdhC family protein [Syntrophobacteraceae bacterium]|nr:XdhC family protein [Syntrophobacteraceae bacterium]
MDIFKRILELLMAGEDLVLAVIASKAGSAPRGVGARMVVRADGAIVGTIGGGLIEAQVQRLAADVFTDRGAVFKKFVLSARDAAQMSMICGGDVEVLIHFLESCDPAGRLVYRQAAEALRLRERAFLITEIPSDGKPVAQCLVKNDGTVEGSLDPTAAKALMPYQGSAGLVSSARGLFLVEPLSNEGAAFIFGAGHVSQKLAPLTRMVGFRTVVLDDRSEFANRERFDCADEIIVPASFQGAMDGLDIDEKSYIVIVSRGHVDDKTLLRQALKTNAGYIGMIGSRKKRDKTYEALASEGFGAGDFDRVHSPIGIAIEAETPEEIAVSIVAELILARAKKNRSNETQQMNL